MNGPTITAHSGCEGTPDGSLASVLAGISLGADFVEVDVRRMQGRGLVLSHDEADDPAGLVTLKEAFEEIRKHPETGINCDLKSYGLAEEVLDLAASCGLAPGQLAFSGSLRPSDLLENPDIARRAAVYLNIEEALAELYRKRRPGGAAAEDSPWNTVRRLMEEGFEPWIAPLLELPGKLPLRALNLPPRVFEPWLERLCEGDLRCSVWTIDEEAAIRRLVAHPGIINLTTRQARLALALRQEIRGTDQCS